MPRIIIFTLLTLIFINFPLKVKGCEEFETVDYQNSSQLNPARFRSLRADSLKTPDTTFTTYISSKSPNWLRSIYQKFKVCRETVGSCAKTFVLVCRKFGIVHIETKPLNSYSFKNLGKISQYTKPIISGDGSVISLTIEGRACIQRGADRLFLSDLTSEVLGMNNDGSIIVGISKNEPCVWQRTGTKYSAIVI